MDNQRSYSQTVYRIDDDGLPMEYEYAGEVTDYGPVIRPKLKSSTSYVDKDLLYRSPRYMVVKHYALAISNLIKCDMYSTYYEANELYRRVVSDYTDIVEKSEEIKDILNDCKDALTKAGF